VEMLFFIYFIHGHFGGIVIVKVIHDAFGGDYTVVLVEDQR